MWKPSKLYSLQAKKGIVSFSPSGIWAQIMNLELKGSLLSTAIKESKFVIVLKVVVSTWISHLNNSGSDFFRAICGVHFRSPHCSLFGSKRF